MKAYLLEALVSSYLRLTILEDAAFVLQKICSTLTALFQKPDSGFTFPIRHILACILNDRFIPHDESPPISELLATASVSNARRLVSVVRLAATIAEDASSRLLSSAERCVWHLATSVMC